MPKVEVGDKIVEYHLEGLSTVVFVKPAKVYETIPESEPVTLGDFHVYSFFQGVTYSNDELKVLRAHVNQEIENKRAKKGR